MNFFKTFAILLFLVNTGTSLFSQKIYNDTIIGTYYLADKNAEKGFSLIVSAGPTINSVYGSMAKKNKENNENPKMKNRVGYIVTIQREKLYNSGFFVSFGLSFIQKQVNPMEGTTNLYKDKLKTAYISIPFEVGFNLIPVEKAFNAAVFIGTSTNCKVIDNSESGPDRPAFKSIFLSQSLIGEARAKFRFSSRNKIVLRYNYLMDITNAYTHNLYSGSFEPNKEFGYKYKTHAISMGLQWALN